MGGRWNRRQAGQRRVQRRLRRDDGGGLRFLRRRPDRHLGLAVRRRAPHVRQPATRARRHDPARAERLPAPVLRAAVEPPVEPRAPVRSPRRLLARPRRRLRSSPGWSVRGRGVPRADRAAGFEPNFRKRTGYWSASATRRAGARGIVSLRRDDPTRLEPGMVFHMPPALRVPRQYGLGYSETVLVTATGCEC